MKSEKVWSTFRGYHSQIKPFRDAGYGDCTYDCTLKHCWEGLEIAVKLGWYSLKGFDDREYEYYEQLQNGDINWIIPG